MVLQQWRRSPIHVIQSVACARAGACSNREAACCSSNSTTRLGSWLKDQPDPVLGFDLKQAVEKGAVQVKPRATSARGNTVQFADGSQL